MAKVEHRKYIPEPEGKIYMGIDQSLTATGIVIIKKTGIAEDILNLNQYKLLHAETIDTKPETGETEVRIGMIKSRIVELISKYGVYSVGIESLAYSGFGQGQNAGQSSNARLLAGLFYTILSELYLLGVNYHVINIKTLKKSVTGNGSADKIDLFESMPEEDVLLMSKLSNKKIGSKKFFDMTDAYWLCRYAIKEDIVYFQNKKNGIKR